jgi:hypothetical protein
MAIPLELASPAFNRTPKTFEVFFALGLGRVAL